MNQKRINSREARAQWRDLLDFIQNENHEVIIERYGKPIGKLIPYQEPKKALQVKETAVIYQAQGFKNMNATSQPNLRAKLQKQLNDLPDAMVEALNQLVSQLMPEEVASLSMPRPQAARSASQWIGLLQTGYEGDALADSESLYE